MDNRKMIFCFILLNVIIINEDIVEAKYTPLSAETKEFHYDKDGNFVPGPKYSEYEKCYSQWKGNFAMSKEVYSGVLKKWSDVDNEINDFDYWFTTGWDNLQSEVKRITQNENYKKLQGAKMKNCETNWQNWNDGIMEMISKFNNKWKEISHEKKISDEHYSTTFKDLTGTLKEFDEDKRFELPDSTARIVCDHDWKNALQAEKKNYEKVIQKMRETVKALRDQSDSLFDQMNEMIREADEIYKSGNFEETKGKHINCASYKLVKVETDQAFQEWNEMANGIKNEEDYVFGVYSEYAEEERIVLANRKETDD